MIIRKEILKRKLTSLEEYKLKLVELYDIHKDSNVRITYVDEYIDVIPSKHIVILEDEK